MTNETGNLSLKQLFNKVLNPTEDAINTTAKVTIDNMDINAEMSEASGHDYYVTTTNVGNGVLTISFDDTSANTDVAITVQDIIKVENKTQGWIYNTKGATVGIASLALVAANQETGYPVCGAGDKFEIVYRGKSRFDAIKTSVQLIDDSIGTDDSAAPATPKFMRVGGEYRSSATTYTDGDGTILQTDINGHLKTAGYDASTRSIKSTETNPIDERYTTAIDLLGGTPVELGTTYVDCGAEISCAGYNHLTFWANVDINSSTNPRIKVMSKPVLAGAVEVPLSSSSVVVHSDNTYVAASASRYFELNDDADQWVQIDVELNNTITSVQLMVADSNDSDGQIDNLYYVLGY